MLLTLTVNSLTLSLMTKMVSHPIMFMAVILAQTLLVCFFSSHFISSPCMALVLFLIFFWGGGAIVLFIYMSSLASNENFLWLSKELLFMLGPISLIIYFVFMMYPSFKHIFDNSPLPMLYPLYSFKFLFMFLILILYLLITLLIVSNVHLSKLWLMPEKPTLWLE